MIYAGIGSRNSPPEILAQMETIARVAAVDGWLLRSGGADGADRAFESGCDDVGGSKEIWLPWRGFNGSKSELIFNQLPRDSVMRALYIAASIHPAWSRCSWVAQRLHARNVLIILGSDFETPVDRVIAWTPEAQLVGGTATALRLAQQRSIEIVNLANAESA